MMTLNISGSNQHQQNSSTSSTSLFSFPSQLRLVEKINHHRREWMAARFCASSSSHSHGNNGPQNILSPSSLLQQAARQPLAIWSRSSSVAVATKMVGDGTAGTAGTGQQQMNIISTGKADAVELLLQLKGEL